MTLLVPVLSVCACFHFAPSVIHSQTAKGNRLIKNLKQQNVGVALCLWQLKQYFESQGAYLFVLLFVISFG